MAADAFKNPQAGFSQALCDNGFAQAASQMRCRGGTQMQFRMKGIQRSGDAASGAAAGIRFRSGHEAQAEFRSGARTAGGQQPGHGVFRIIKGGEGFRRGRQPVSEAGEQTRAGLLIRPVHAGESGQSADVVLGQSGFGQRRANPQFFKGAQTGPVAFPVRGVAAVAKDGSLPGKGRIAVGGDADLVALDAGGKAHQVLVRGVPHVRDGAPVRRGMFER